MWVQTTRKEDKPPLREASAPFRPAAARAALLTANLAFPKNPDPWQLRDQHQQFSTGTRKTPVGPVARATRRQSAAMTKGDRKEYSPWTEEEAQALAAGLAKYGFGEYIIYLQLSNTDPIRSHLSIRLTQSFLAPPPFIDETFL